VLMQLRTDNHIEGTEALEERVNAMIEQHLGRFLPRLSRIEVHLSDSNGGKGGDSDKRCNLEARMDNVDPVGVSHDDENVERAIRGACDKLRARLDTLIGKRQQH
jgi:ribosome-associated translation inhibitor RaiA